MDIPLPDEIPLPSDGGEDSQPGPPGEGPPRPMGRGRFQRPIQGPRGPPGPRMMNQPRPPNMLVPPPMIPGMPPFMQGPPPPAQMPEEKEPKVASERYSPSRVTGDDDEKEQPSISAIFAQEQNLPHSTSMSTMPSQSSPQSQQSISAIFDSFLTPPPQIRPPIPHNVHDQNAGNRYHSMPPQYPMNNQPPPHGPHGNGPPHMPMGPPSTGPHGMPMGPPGMPTGPPGGSPHGMPMGPPRMPGGPPMPPGSGPPPTCGPPGSGPPPHHGPPGTGPPHPRGHPPPYFPHRPPYHPFNPGPGNQPPFNPPRPSGNRMPRPYRSGGHSNSYLQSKMSNIPSSVSDRKVPPYAPLKDETPVASEAPTDTMSVTSLSAEKTDLSADVELADETPSSETDKAPSSDIQKSDEEKSSAPEGEASETTLEATPIATSSVISSLASSVTTTSTDSSETTSVASNIAELAAKQGAEAAPNNTTNEVTEKPVKKVLTKVLGKHGAKKRLLSYTGKLALAKTTKLITSSNADDDDEGNEKKKAIAQAKKKKKEEKMSSMSSIEQIKNEESRIKEALGLKNVLFSPYGPGLAPIAKLLDNPDELRKFEVRGKQAKVKLEEYEVRSKNREKEEKKKEKTEKERDKKGKDREEKEKDKDKETDKEKEAENEKNDEEGKTKVHDTAGDGESKSDSKDQEEIKKKPQILPKTWREFKAEGHDFETLRLAIREHQRRRRSRSRERNRPHRNYGHDKKDSKDDSDPYGQSNLLMYPVNLKSLNGMRLQYPAKMVQYTKTLPSISFGINYHKFVAHYLSRTEMKVKEPSEIWEICEDFWSAKPVYHKKHSKGKSRAWFKETLEGKALKTKKETNKAEKEVVKEKPEKKSKVPRAPPQTDEKVLDVPMPVIVKNVNQEVAKAATKSRWDSDNEEGEDSRLDFEKEEMPSSSTSEVKAVEEDTATENDFLSSDNTTNVDGDVSSASGKPFPEGLNEEYEAFLEILGGGSEAKEDEKEPDAVSVSKRKEQKTGEESEDDEGMFVEPIGDKERDLDKEDALKMLEPAEEDSKLPGEKSTVKKTKSEKKLKKQMKKAKKREKKAKKKAKKKTKKGQKKKKVSKKESKKSSKKGGAVEDDGASDSSVIHIKDPDSDGNSERRRRMSSDDRENIEDRERDYAKRQTSEDRHSEDREFSERRRRGSPDRRDDYDRRRGGFDDRDMNYRREGRGFYRGRGGDRRRDDYGDYRGRFRGHGYERRGRGRGFGRGFGFRDRRGSFRDRREDENREGRVYERGEDYEDYEVHREFIREKRYEWKEALEEGRNLRRERQARGEYVKRKSRHQGEKGVDEMEDARSYSPARTISDEDDDDDDVKSVDLVRDDDRSDIEEIKEDYPKKRREKRLPSPARSPSQSPSPERIIDSDEDLSGDEEGRRKSKKRSVWDVEESNTCQSWKSKDSSPNHNLDLDEKASVSTRYPTSDTSGYYDLSSAPSPEVELDTAEMSKSPKNQNRSERKSKKHLEISLDDIPYPPEGPSGNRVKLSSAKTQPSSDRYSPSNVSGSPISSPSNSPRALSPSLEIPLPPSVQSIPVPPVKRTSESEVSILHSDLKGISLPPTGIPLPSGTPRSNENPAVSKVPMAMPTHVAYPTKAAFVPVPPPPALGKPVPPPVLPIPKAREDPLGSLYEIEGEEISKADKSLLSSAQDIIKSSMFSMFPAAGPSVAETMSLEVLKLKEPDSDKSESPLKSDTFPTKWVEKSVDDNLDDNMESEEKVKTSRSMPITFRLGGSKQATMKRLQKGPVLPEFDHDDEEEGKIGLDLDKDDDDEDERGEYGGEVERQADESLKNDHLMEQPSKSSPPPSPKVVDSGIPEHEPEEDKDVGTFDRSRSRSAEKSHLLVRSSKSPQRIKTLPHKETSPYRSPSRERSRSPKNSRNHYKSKSPPRNRSPVRSRSPQRNRSPKRNRSPRRSRSRSWSPRRTGGRRSPPRKRRMSPEYRRYRGSPDRGRRREFGSPRRVGRWPRDGRSPPPRGLGLRGSKDRRSPRRYSRSPSPLKGDRFASPDSRHSRTPEKIHALLPQGPRTPEGPSLDDVVRSPNRLGSPVHRDKEFRGGFKEKIGSRSPNRPPSPETIGRRYPSPPGGRKIRKDYRSSRSPSSRSPDRWVSRHHSPGRRSPNWSPGRQRPGSPGLRSPYRSPDGRSQYSPGREKVSPSRRWSPVRSRSPRRSPLRKSPVRRPQIHRSSSRSPLRRSRSRSPIRRSSSRSPIRRSPIRRSPRWSRSPPGRKSPLRRSPLRRSPLRRSPGRSPLRRSPLRRSPLRRSPSRRSPLRKSPRRSPRNSRSPSKDFDYERHERGGWSNWKWEKDQEDNHKDPERWTVRPPSPKDEPPVDKYYKKKSDRKEGTLKIDADSTISDSELVIKKEPVDSSSPSPQHSPRWLSLDERLQREHGVDVEDQVKKRHPPPPSQPQVYNWGYQAHPVQVHQFQYAYEGSAEGTAGEGGSGEGSSRVIQVGNMLQVLPQDPATSTAQPPMIVQQVLPQEPGTTPTPSPMIVQTGNVIQVVPAENMLGTEAVSSGGVMGMGGVVQVVTGGMLGSSPTPVPAPVMSSASGVSKSTPSDTQVTVSSVLSSLSSIQLPGTSVLTSTSQSSSMTPVTTVASSSVTPPTTSSTTHAAGLPVAHLISLLQQQQQMASLNEAAADQEAKAAAKEKAREVRKEKKEKRRMEREARREARQKEKAAAAQRKKERDLQGPSEENQNSDTEDEVLIREAIYEVPNIGSPVPEYEIMREEDEEEDEEEALLKKKRRLPVPLPPAEKGILMSPSYRYREEYHPKAVKFADGVLPGEGTSPSGGEEIHSPPPPGDNKKPKEKKLRKKRKVKVKIIKEYKVNDEDDDSPPPPPPGSPPPLAALKLYPGYTHYSYTAPGTVVIYAQQPQQTYTYSPGQPQGTVTVPGGMVIQQGASTQPQAAIGSLSGVSSGVFRYPGYVYTTLYSAGQQLQYVLPGSLPSQPSTSSPQKMAKK